jgi:hypothetical protein
VPPGVQETVVSRPPLRGSLLLLVLLSSAAPGLGGQATGQDLPVSIDRIRAGVQKPVVLEVDVTSLVPVATFRTGVDQQFLPTLEEQLRREFTPTAFQRQSWEWGAKCCGLDLGGAFDAIRRAMREERERRIRERIARELEALQAAADRR